MGLSVVGILCSQSHLVLSKNCLCSKTRRQQRGGELGLTRFPKLVCPSAVILVPVRNTDSWAFSRRL